MGIKLREGDVVVDALLLDASTDSALDDVDEPTLDDVEEAEAFEDGAVRLLVVTEGGYGKRTSPEEFRPQNRNGMGIRAHNLDHKSGEIAGGVLVTPDDNVMVVTDTGRVIRFRAGGVPIYGRYSRGVRIMRLDDEERLVDLARLEEDDEDPDVIDDDDGLDGEIGEGTEAGVPEDGATHDDDEG